MQCDLARVRHYSSHFKRNSENGVGDGQFLRRTRQTDVVLADDSLLKGHNFGDAINERLAVQVAPIVVGSLD